MHNRVKERPKCRQAINEFCSEYGLSLRELSEYTKYDRTDPEWTPLFTITGGLRTQLNKMIEENKLKEYVENLSFIEKNGKKYPIVFCQFDIRSRSYVFYCPYCRRKHSHSPYEGYRQSHCHDQNSFLKNGYYLKLEAKK